MPQRRSTQTLGRDARVCDDFGLEGAQEAEIGQIQSVDDAEFVEADGAAVGAEGAEDRWPERAVDGGDGFDAADV